VVVFLGFAVGDVLVVKEFGLGLALTILIDATIVRTLLVPAVMKLMGRWNWWAPGTRRATPGAMVPASTIEMPQWPTASEAMAASREGKDG
jgi:uncharacterized membrane protein YdfJ with MMPL/SSD domain